MEKKTINTIKRFIKRSKNLTNAELARIIYNESDLNLSVGSLQNYISKVKSLPEKIVDTKKGNVTKVAKEQKPMTPKDHINGYLVAYENMSYSDIAKMMHKNGVCKQYTEGTLRNYISAAAKTIDDFKQGGLNSEKVIKTVNKKDKKLIANHEIFIVDTNCVSPSSLNDILYGISKNVDNKNTVISFDESVNVNLNFREYSEVNFAREHNLGLNLLSAISTAVQLAMNNKKAKTVATNITIITSGGDNLSQELSYNDIRWMMDELKTNYNWNINLIFTGERKEEATTLGMLLGIDSSNVTTDWSTSKVLNAINKRINNLINGTELFALNYFK